MKIVDLTIKKTHEALENNKISSVEVTNEAISRVNKIESIINSFITFTPEIALKEASKVDKLISEGQKIDYLAGIPV